jgi:hypothetical protein
VDANRSGGGGVDGTSPCVLTGLTHYVGHNILCLDLTEPTTAWGLTVHVLPPIFERKRPPMTSREPLKPLKAVNRRETAARVKIVR